MTERKASDLLLDLEENLNTLIGLVKNQDLNIKILSNKVNDLTLKLNNVNIIQSNQPKIIAETTKHVFKQASKDLLVADESPYSVEEQPIGLRRNSRPETYSQEERDGLISKPNTAPVINNEVIVKNALTKNVQENNVIQQNNIIQENNLPDSFQRKSSVPVFQKLLDRHNKPVFLADVEIISINNSSSVVKTRTNGNGKWSTVLPNGEYKAFVRKKDLVSKNMIEVCTDFKVDGSKSPYELPQMLLK